MQPKVKLIPGKDRDKPIEEIPVTYVTTKTYPDLKLTTEQYESALDRFILDSKDLQIKFLVDKAREIAHVVYKDEILITSQPFGGKNIKRLYYGPENKDFTNG